MARCTTARSTLAGALLAGAFIPFSSAAALAQPDGTSKTVIGEQFALSVACYERARDGEVGAEALASCNRSLQEERLTNRRRAIVYANRGVVNYNMGAYEDSILDFTESLDLGIFARAQILANRGLAYEALRLDALARADYAEAVALNPNNEVAKRRLEELKKPLYERSLVPRRITAEAQPPADPS